MMAGWLMGNLLVRGVGEGAARIPRYGGNDARRLFEIRFRAPEVSPGEYGRRFFSGGGRGGNGCRGVRPRLLERAIAVYARNAPDHDAEGDRGRIEHFITPTDRVVYGADMP